MNTVIGVFDNPRDAQPGIAMLRDSRYTFEDISLISKAVDKEVAVNDGVGKMSRRVKERRLAQCGMSHIKSYGSRFA